MLLLSSSSALPGLCANPCFVRVRIRVWVPRDCLVIQSTNILVVGLECICLFGYFIGERLQFMYDVIVFYHVSPPKVSYVTPRVLRACLAPRLMPKRN